MLKIAIDYLLSFAVIAIFARVIISWIPISRDNQIIKLLYQITEPILAPIRGFLERSSFGKNMTLDFSPFIALIIIGFVKNLIRAYL